MPTLRELAEYHKPTEVAEAMRLLRRTGVRTVPIAGGTSLVPSAARDVEAVVDLGALGLSYVKTSEGLEIGATTTLQAIADHQDVRTFANGVLVKAIRDEASRNVREAATLGGSIVSATGNSPLYTALLALDARLTVRRARSTRDVVTSLAYWMPQPHTLILRVTLPALPDQTHAAYEKVARTPADRPIVCVVARATARDGKLNSVRLALGGVGGLPIVITKSHCTTEQAVRLASAAIDPPSDYFATASYRREMIGVLVRRLLSNLAR